MKHQLPASQRRWSGRGCNPVRNTEGFFGLRTHGNLDQIFEVGGALFARLAWIPKSLRFACQRMCYRQSATERFRICERKCVMQPAKP